MNRYQQEIESFLNAKSSGLKNTLSDMYRSLIIDLKQDLKNQMAMYAGLSYSRRLEVARMQSLLIQMENKLDTLNGVQKDHVVNYLRSVGHTAYNELFYEFEQQHGFGLIFNKLPEDVLETIINAKTANVRLSERLKDGLVSELKANLTSALYRGFSRGWGYQKIARELAEAGNSSFSRAMRIARTEGGRITSVTRQKSQREARRQGVELEKQWVSTLDKRTRDTHQELDGKVVGIDEYFEVRGLKTLQPNMFGIAEEDINCRCRTLSVIKGYKSGTRIDGETGKVGKYANYTEWLSAKGG